MIIPAESDRRRGYTTCPTCSSVVRADGGPCRICRTDLTIALLLPPAPAGAVRTPPRAVAPVRVERKQSTAVRSPAPVRSPAAILPAPAARRPLPTVPPTLRVGQVTKTFGQGHTAVTPVRDVSFDAGPGEVVLIMGPSGSGKTTLLLMLGAMLRPTAGSVCVAGVDMATAPQRKLPKLRATNLGFVFQDFNLLGALSATENVEYACNLAGVRGHRAADRAEQLLRQVGLGHRLHSRPVSMSGGEQQRVAIARALANDPPLILADEPTANLDAATGRSVAHVLRGLASDQGRTCVIVTHDERLEAIADRVLWLDDGHLLTGGGPSVAAGQPVIDLRDDEDSAARSLSDADRPACPVIKLRVS